MQVPISGQDSKYEANTLHWSEHAIAMLSQVNETLYQACNSEEPRAVIANPENYDRAVG